MRSVKNIKFWKHTAEKIGLESMESKGQGRENRRINSRKNSHCIQ